MNGPFNIRTHRLELFAGNHEMAQAEMTSIIRLSRLLNAGFDHGWPPPENDENTMEWFFTRIYDNPDARGWLMWYFVLNENNKRTAIGNGGFTGPPDEEGIVECKYSILEAVQKNGFATEALSALVKWAFTFDCANKIIAHIPQANKPGIKVLENNNFKLSGVSSETQRLIYALSKKS